MELFLVISLSFFVLGGVGSLCSGRSERVSSLIGASGTVLGCLCGLVSLFDALEFPGVFRLIICLVGIASALHAPGYLSGQGGRRTGFFWLFFNMTLAAMMMITVPMEFVPFLLCWEAMGLASYALVAYEYHEAKTRDASWIYLLSCEAGGILLMLAYAYSSSGWHSEICEFYLLLAGFGIKAGVPFLHVWLADAHPAAPAPVSSLMSAAMIPLGFYGLLQFMSDNYIVMTHCGWALLLLGTLGAFGGILFALPQNNLKRLLAYSSVENMGIAAMGFGLGILGEVYEIPMMAACGFCGGTLHLLHHALLKGTLFLGAGSVLKATGTLKLDSLGGLMKVMPWTGRCFALGATGICGLPPFCGFVGELLIYIAAFTGIAEGQGGLFAASLAASLALVLTGGVACAALAKAVGGAFLGEPRTDFARNAQHEKFSMALPQIALMAIALLLPLAYIFLPVPFAFTGSDESSEIVASILRKCGIFIVLFYCVIGIVLLLRRLVGRDARSVGTWDCGYARPTSRMEYTGSALVQPLADQFGGVLGLKRKCDAPSGLFPKTASLTLKSRDLGLRIWWTPIFNGFSALAEKIHRFQSGYLHVYMLIMVLTIALMLVWAFFA